MSKHRGDPWWVNGWAFVAVVALMVLFGVWYGSGMVW